MINPTDNFRKHTTRNPLQKLLIENFLNSLVKELGKLRLKNILDVGCGEGFTLAKIRKANIGKHLEGIEFNSKAIELGKKRYPYLILKQGNIYNLPYQDNAFDIVLCTEVLEHLEYPEKALKELYRISRRYCLISVPNEPLFRIANFLRGKNLPRWGNDIEHIQHWSSKEIAKLVGKYFKVLVVKNPFPWTLITAEK